MATIKPFMAIRPTAQYAKDVAALPYDVMNSEEARAMVENAPYSFLHIDKPEIDLPRGTNPYSPEVYEKAKENLNSLIEKEILIQDLLPNFYIYRLTREGKSQTGLVVCTSVDEYLQGIIKKHELTREDKEADRIRHLDVLNTHTGPIFMAYKKNETATAIINGWMTSQVPTYDFVSEDGIEHTVWTIDSDTEIGLLVNVFKEVENLYIADGHHRNESAAKVALKRREEKGTYNPEADFNFYLSVLFPADDLQILDYNRVIKDLNGLSKEDFLLQVEKKFHLAPTPNNVPFKPVTPHTFGMYVDGQWYELGAKESILNTDPVLGLDVSLLHHELLHPILAIGDPRTDKRIDFVGGIRGVAELAKRVDNKEMALAFALYPTSMEELMNVADAGFFMPPKSTWFEPKLRSGLFLHDLGE